MLGIFTLFLFGIKSTISLTYDQQLTSDQNEHYSKLGPRRLAHNVTG